MRTKFLVAILAIFVVVGAVWLPRPSHVAPNSTEPARTANAVQPEEISGGRPSTDRRAGVTKAKPKEDTAPAGQSTQQRLEEIATNRGVPLNVLTQQAVIQWSNAWGQASREINRAIEFYGKVVDENGSPIQRANIEFSAIVFPEEQFQTNLLSDANGMFALNNVPGAILLVQVSKEIYEEVQWTNQNKFNYYAPSGSRSSFRPDSNSPVVFHLRKKTN